jgi:hypothetical protein
MKIVVSSNWCIKQDTQYQILKVLRLQYHHSLISQGSQQSTLQGTGCLSFTLFVNLSLFSRVYGN